MKSDHDTSDLSHPFVGLTASGQYSTTSYPTPTKWEDASGTIVSYSGAFASLLLADGRIVAATMLKLDDPDEARARLLARK